MRRRQKRQQNSCKDERGKGVERSTAARFSALEASLSIGERNRVSNDAFAKLGSFRARCACKTGCPSSRYTVFHSWIMVVATTVKSKTEYIRTTKKEVE